MEEPLKRLCPSSTLAKWFVFFLFPLWCILNPSQILVHGPSAAADALIEACKNIRSMTKDIYAPPAGESVQIGQQTNSFSINIGDELLASLKFSRVSTFPHGGLNDSF